MEMQMEIKSGWKEEGGQMSLSASAMLGRWETDRCSVQNQFPETSARCAWGDRSFSRSSSAPCGGSTVFWWLTDTIFFGGGWHPPKNAPPPSSQLLSEALCPRCQFVVSLWGRSPACSLQLLHSEYRRVFDARLLLRKTPALRSSV